MLPSGRTLPLITPRRQSPVLFLSGEGPAKPRRKRVKRKEPIESPEKEETVKQASVVPDLKPRNDAPVELKIRDVRDVVSGQSSFPNQQEGIPRLSSVSLSDSSVAGGSSSGDSLEQLLADAKAMRQDNDEESKRDGSIQESVRNFLSTIVTIDFFVVCALLVWFLAGIFSSYVLKNDAVQIAFNGIFEPVVQPALGVLMIGSAASGMCCTQTGYDLLLDRRDSHTCICIN